MADATDRILALTQSVDKPSLLGIEEKGDLSMEAATPKLGVKMSPQQAKDFVTQLNEKVLRRWDERVTRGPFMSQFLSGKLPMAAIKLFFRNWGNFTVEINTLIAASYHKHIGFFKRHPDLLGPFGAKVADEFIHPEPPGHILVMLQTAEALGLSKDEVLRQPMLPEARAILDFKRALLWEGTVAEWWFSMLTEEPVGHWAGAWFKALTSQYGFSRQQAVYFSTHEEADLQDHDAGVMGHGSFNRMVMQRILEDGYADVREGYSLEYCAIASVDLYGLMHRAAFELAR
jgi:pyrroloquinoline quinone (PQQ) biosynthesis protein C